MALIWQCVALPYAMLLLLRGSAGSCGMLKCVSLLFVVYNFRLNGIRLNGGCYVVLRVFCLVCAQLTSSSPHPSPLRSRGVIACVRSSGQWFIVKVFQVRAANVGRFIMFAFARDTKNDKWKLYAERGIWGWGEREHISREPSSCESQRGLLECVNYLANMRDWVTRIVGGLCCFDWYVVFLMGLLLYFVLSASKEYLTFGFNIFRCVLFSLESNSLQKTLTTQPTQSQFHAKNKHSQNIAKQIHAKHES